jgi:ribonucleoside-diphosphate reductase alpha chain
MQYNVPLDAMVKKFSHARFEPSGWTTNPDIPVAKSVVDYIFRWLGIQFLEGYREANTPKRDEAGGGHGPGDTANFKTPSSQEAKGGAGLKDAADAKPQAVNRLPAGPKKNGSNGAHKNGLEKGPGARGQGSGNGNGNGHGSVTADSSIVSLSTLDSRHSSRSEQFAHFQSDAPACDNCGAITVRNGNCYLCHNCGQSMGCS